MEYELTWGGEIEDIQLRTWGPASLEGLRGYMDEALNDSRWRPGMRVLIDHRDIDWSALTATDFRRRVDVMLSRRDRFRGAYVAVVVAGTSAYGVVRMMQGLADDYGDGAMMRMQIFYSVEDARAWLRDLP